MHPGRVAILEALRYEEACVCHLETLLERRQSYISQQLAVLRQVGLVTDRRDGPNAYYRVARPEVFTVLDAARTITGEAGQRESLERLTQCPCPKCTPDDGGTREAISP